MMIKKTFLALAIVMISHAQGVCEVKTDSVSFIDYYNDCFKSISSTNQSASFTTDNGITWSVETDAEKASQEDSTYPYVYFGTTKSSVSYVTFSTSDIPGYISSITVTVRENKTNNTGVYLNVSIGDELITNEKIATNPATTDIENFTHSMECFNKGEVVIELYREESAKCGICCYTMIIEYDPDVQDFYEESTSNTIEPSESASAYVHRSFSSDYWNTLCLPFSLSAEQITDMFGEETTICEFESINGDTLNFSEVDAIEAGTPYLFKPEDTVDDPYFEDVVISDTQPQTVTHNGYSFIGVYNATELDASDVFLGTDGNLYHPAEATNTIKGMRAYFQIPTTSLASKAVLNVTRGNTTGIASINAEQAHDDRIYNMCGMLVGRDETSLSKGVYIRDGKKIIIK